MKATRTRERTPPELDVPLRDVRLPAGRLIIRPVRPDDALGLEGLYGRLSMEDRYHRFFSFYQPSADFLDHLARVREEGGDGVVAVLDDGRIVGEADYFRLPDGSGEFAIVVASDWRGWLGPSLLDALVERAAARGVPSLQADILLENAPMLALVRARGFVTLDHSGPVVRVAIGAAERLPRWPADDGRRRVLVESPGAWWRAEADARAAGFRVAVCPGPGAHCPVLRGEPCPLATGADAIVLDLDLDDTRAQALLEAHRTLHPRVPLCIEGGRSNTAIIAMLERLTRTPSTKGADVDE